MLLWQLYQFGSVVADFCGAADGELWEAMEDRLALLMERGNEARMPVSEPLGNGLFALRANADNRQGRLLYFFGSERKQIVFVNFVLLKKQRRIAQDVLEEAARRKAWIEAKDIRGGINEFRIDRPH